MLDVRSVVQMGKLIESMEARSIRAIVPDSGFETSAKSFDFYAGINDFYAGINGWVSLWVFHKDYSFATSAGNKI